MPSILWLILPSMTTASDASRAPRELDHFLYVAAVRCSLEDLLQSVCHQIGNKQVQRTMRLTLKIICTAFTLLFCHISSNTALAETSSERAQATLASEPREFPAQVEAAVRAEVTSAVAGTVLQVHFEPGQTVQQGEILFTLDTAELALAEARARAVVERTSLNLEALMEDLERVEELKKRGTASELQLIKAKRIAQIAEADLRDAEAVLQAAQIRLDRTNIRAPISGIAGRPQTAVGAQVGPGKSGALTEIIQMDPILIAYKTNYVATLQRLNLKSLKDIEGILSFVTLKIKIADDWIYKFPPRPIHGSAGVDPDSGEMTFWAEVVNPNHLLRPGMKVSVLSSNRLLEQ